MNLNISASKIGALQMGSKTLIGDYFESGCNDFDYTSIIYGECIPKYTQMHGIFRKTTLHSRGIES
jgi:hypothetical protein